MFWYYVYSPKYEIFHHIIRCNFKEGYGLDMQGLFVPQEVFSNIYKRNGQHFFAGITIKIELLIQCLELHQGEHIIFSDADIIVNKIAKLAEYLQSYKQYDMTFMKDNFNDETRNIGFSLIKSTPETINFFKKVYEEIKKTQNQDQSIINNLLPTFTGSHTMFSVPEIIQSNMIYYGQSDFYILQLLCSHNSSDINIGEKLVTASKFINIKSQIHLVSQETRDWLKKWFTDTEENMFWVNDLCR
jgi:hypothetical protein